MQFFLHVVGALLLVVAQHQKEINAPNLDQSTCQCSRIPSQWCIYLYSTSGCRCSACSWLTIMANYYHQK